MIKMGGKMIKNPWGTGNDHLDHCNDVGGLADITTRPPLLMGANFFGG
jgi:hypothetical protein